MRCSVALAAVVLFALAAVRAQREPAAEYIAFRVDDQRLIATLLVREPTPPQITEGFLSRPAARYGYLHLLSGA